MTKPTSYELLKDVYKVVNRLEDKMDDRMNEVEERVDVVEGKTDSLLGKIGIGVMIVSAAISLLFMTVGSWIKKTFNI